MEIERDVSLCDSRGISWRLRQGVTPLPWQFIPPWSEPGRRRVSALTAPFAAAGCTERTVILMRPKTAGTVIIYWSASGAFSSTASFYITLYDGVVRHTACTPIMCSFMAGNFILALTRHCRISAKYFNIMCCQHRLRTFIYYYVQYVCMPSAWKNERISCKMLHQKHESKFNIMSFFAFAPSDLIN